MSKHIIIRETALGGVMIMDMAAAAAAMPSAAVMAETVPADNNNAPWSKWGPDNLKPQQMAADIKTCGILNSIIDGKARFAMCQGMVPAIVKRDKTGMASIESIVEDPEITQFMEMNDINGNLFGWMKDMIGFGNGCARLVLNKGFDKVVTIRRHDITEIRAQAKDKAGKIKHVYFSANWDKTFSDKSDHVFKRPLLDLYNPLDDLKEKASKKQAEHVMLFRYPGWGEHYYSTGGWMAALKWVRIAQGIPEMKAAMFQNTMRLKYLVLIHPEYWEKAKPGFNALDPDKQETVRAAVYDEINNFLVGAANAHKSVFSEMQISPVDGKFYGLIDFKLLEDRDIDGELLKDSSTANSEIAFSLLFNPAIIGASLPAGPYTNSQGGSNVRESVLLQIILHELERQNVQRVMNVVKYFNKWDVKHPGLQFIIPANVITTLDTGAGSKPVVTGSAGSGN